MQNFQSWVVLMWLGWGLLMHRSICATEYETQVGRILLDDPISTAVTRTTASCLLTCEWNLMCASVNVIAMLPSEYQCEMFDVSAAATRKVMVVSDAGIYAERVTKRFLDCAEAGRIPKASGPAELISASGGTFTGYCSTEFDGGGWLVVQRRIDDSVDFEGNWEDYKNGFGNISGTFWFGLDKLHELTKNGDQTLRFDMWDGTEHRYAEYKNTTVADEADNYRLKFTTYEGTAGNSMGYSNNMQFSTKDNDNDNHPTGSCADKKRAGWWLDRCTKANPNGIYGNGVTSQPNGIYWQLFRGTLYSLQRIEMKLKAK